MRLKLTPQEVDRLELASKDDRVARLISDWWVMRNKLIDLGFIGEETCILCGKGIVLAQSRTMSGQDARGREGLMHTNPTDCLFLRAALLKRR